MKKVTLLSIMFVLLLIGTIYSCTGFEEPDFNKSTALTSDAQALKELYQAEIPKFGELIETRTECNLTQEEANIFLSSFSTQTVKMLKSYGFTEKDWEEFESIQDPAFILSGMLFLAVMDTNNEDVSFSLLKTRATEESDDDTCFSWEQLGNCLATAALGDNIVKAIKQELIGVTCVTKTIFWSVVKRVIKNFGLVISIASFVYEFSYCIGWL